MTCQVDGKCSVHLRIPQNEAIRGISSHRPRAGKRLSLLERVNIVIYSNASSATATAQRPGNETSALLLAELERAHDELLSAIATMDAVTHKPTAARDQYINARWRISRASLNRRTLWGKIFQHLSPRVNPSDAAALRSLQSANHDTLHRSAAHVGKWTVALIEADWPGYCEASDAIRAKLKDRLDADKRILCPILRAHALGLRRRQSY